MKRMFDFIAALVGLIGLLPLFFVIALLIKWDDHGPVIFKQNRVGKNGKLFILYKFRTMTVLKYANDGLFEPGNTSRITPVGKFLRRTKLDELPQLMNVVLGDMSLVGPRPEVERWVNYYPERWAKILLVRPGITNIASIEFRNEESLLAASEEPEKTYQEIILPKKLDLYEYYIENQSFLGDLQLIFKTCFYIFFRE